MGGYASTPRKAKTSEEGTDGILCYAASGMQGWRAGMEDAHIALIKVPPGTPPSAAEIGAARIGSTPRASFHHPLSASQSTLENLGSSANLTATLLGVTTSESANPVNGGGSRGRAFTYPAEDAIEVPLSSLKASEGAFSSDGAEGERSGEGKKSRDEGATSAVEARGDGGGAGDDSLASYTAASGENAASAAGGAAGWKAVDLLEDAALFGVFDGHGGKAVAELCRERLPGLLAASPEIRAGNWKTGFPQVFHTLDALIASGEAQEKGGVWGVSGKVDGVGVGCTIVTALLDKKRGECYVAHAGDSRGVLCRAGRAVQLTRDHKPRLPAEYARILAAGGHVSRVGRVNDNLNLSRAIGDMAYKRNRLREPKDQIISAEPDVCRFSVTPGVDEFLLLGCDGVWEVMNSSEVVGFVRAGLRAGAAPLEVCENLLDASLSPDPRGTRYAGCDNMTVVLILFNGWETAVAKHTRARAMTYSGERRETAEEVVAGLPLIVSRPPRRDSEPHPPVSSRPVVPDPKAGETGTRNVEASPAGGVGAAAGTPAATTTASSPSASAMPITTPEMPQQRVSHQRRASVEILASSMPGAQRVNGIRLSRRRSEADSAALLARRLRAEAVPGWSSRRLSVGGMARPFNTTGIEFSLASFSAPVVPLGYASSRASSVLHRSSTSSSIIAAATAAGVRLRNSGSAWEGPHPTSRRRVGHLRSATAPMLPSPLIHHHRRSPGDKSAIAAALVATNESRAFVGKKSLGLEEVDPATLECPKLVDESAPGEGSSPATGVSSSPECAVGVNVPATGRSDDAGVSLMFVPAPQGLSTVDLTVATSPRHPR